MKTFLITTLFLLVIDGCSTRNAFTNFNLTQNQAKSEDSILNAKIYKGKKITGVVSAVYLNRVLPKEYNTHEYFYIVLYDKHKNTDKKIKFIVNGKEALAIKKLKENNEFSDLISSNSDWKRYYLVEFEKQGANLKLKVKIAKHKSDNLMFRKE
jgi:hypothetical protein